MGIHEPWNYVLSLLQSYTLYSHDPRYVVYPNGPSNTGT